MPVAMFVISKFLISKFLPDQISYRYEIQYMKFHTLNHYHSAYKVLHTNHTGVTVHDECYP